MKNNKLIAEFMGVEYTGTRVKDYDTSWDWLMPVVEKCMGLYEHYEVKRIADAVMTFDINTAYAEVVEFIEYITAYQKSVVEFINEHNKYICGSCGDHVNEVVFNEDADVDECTNCTEYYDR